MREAACRTSQHLHNRGQAVNLVAGMSAGFWKHVRYPPLLCKRITPSTPRYRGGSFHRGGSHSPLPGRPKSSVWKMCLSSFKFSVRGAVGVGRVVTTGGGSGGGGGGGGGGAGAGGCGFGVGSSNVVTSLGTATLVVTLLAMLASLS